MKQFRLNENAIFLDTVKTKKTQSFNIFKVQIDSDYSTRPLNSAKVKSQKIPQLFNKRVTLGSGYKVKSQFNAVYNTIYSKDISNGIIINHLSDDAYVEDKYAGKQLDNIHMYFKKIQSNVTIKSTIDYNRSAFFSYGQGTSDKKKYDNSITKNNPYLNRLLIPNCFCHCRIIIKKIIMFPINLVFLLQI